LSGAIANQAGSDIGFSGAGGGIGAEAVFVGAGMFYGVDGWDGCATGSCPYECYAGVDFLGTSMESLGYRFGFLGTGVECFAFGLGLFGPLAIGDRSAHKRTSFAHGLVIGGFVVAGAG
jgi:hypothetical protein